jgi:MoxR-like ATPase
MAAIRGRDHVRPEEVKDLVSVTLAHRLIVKPEAELRGRTATGILEDVLKNTPLNLGTVED